jgi:hypothetical protein
MHIILHYHISNTFRLILSHHQGQNISGNNIYINIYTGCPRRKGPNFGGVFLRSNYTDITQNTYIQS